MLGDNCVVLPDSLKRIFEHLNRYPDLAGHVASYAVARADVRQRFSAFLPDGEVPDSPVLWLAMKCQLTSRSGLKAFFATAVSM
jgi:hypothetical protein